MMIPHSCAVAHERTMRSTRARQQAELEVLRKFPKIIIGSSGWYRAVANRRDRILRTML